MTFMSSRLYRHLRKSSGARNSHGTRRGSMKRNGPYKPCEVKSPAVNSAIGFLLIFLIEVLFLICPKNLLLAWDHLGNRHGVRA